MATVNGARAAGFGDQVGRIRAGDKADLVLLDLCQPTSTRPTICMTSL